MTEISLSDRVAENETKLKHLELKSDADDRTISLLKEQNGNLSAELSEVRGRHEAEISAMRQERDVATRKAKEVEGLISQICSLGLEGIRKMRGDETPKDIPDKQTEDRNDKRIPVTQLKAADRPLEPTRPEIESMLPRLDFETRGSNNRETGERRPLFLERPLEPYAKSQK